MSEQTTEEIKIKGEFTPDPNICRFIVNRPVLENWNAQFTSAEAGMDSPLVNALFSVKDVSAVRVQGSTLSVTKNSSEVWPKVAGQLIPLIKAVLASGQPAFSAAALEKIKATPPVDDMSEAIENLFEQQINPALKSHGGYVKLIKVEDRDVYLEMGGGCQGCSASQATLKYGIESAIREVVPQVREVIDATDHGAGDNPYYK